MSYFEYSDRPNDSASKFWEIVNTGTSYSVRCGKIGTIGKTKVKEFNSIEACREKVAKEIKGKVAKGYRRIDLRDIEGLEQLSDRSLFSILSAIELPAIFLEWVAKNNNDYEILKAIAFHPQATKNALESIASSIYDNLIELVELHVNYAGEISEGWQEKAITTIKQTNLYPIRKQAKELAILGIIPDFLLDILALNTRVAIARNPQTASKTLSYLATDWHENVRKAVAQNPNTSQEILKKLILDNAIALRLAIAKNPDTPAEILNLLADDPYEKVRKALVKNPNVPGDAVFKLRKLLGYNLKSYLQKIAIDSTTSPQILAQLAKEDEWHIRNLVAQNPNTPIEILEQLAEDWMPYVRCSAAQNVNSTEEVALKVLFYKHKPKDLVNRKIKPPVAIDIAGEEYLIESTIYVEDENALAAAASHPKLSLNIIEQLIDNIEQFLQWKWGNKIVIGIVSNPNLPVTTLRWFAGEEYLKFCSDKIYQRLIYYYDLACQKKDSLKQAEEAMKSMMLSTSNERALESLYPIYWGIIQNSTTPVDVIHTLLIRLEKLSSPQKLAKNLNISPHVLATLANHKDSDLRKLVAENPNTPQDILQQLANDENQEVEEAAKAQLQPRQNLDVAIASKQPEATLSLPNISILARSKSPYTRLVVLLDSETPVEILEKAWRSPLWLDRYAIASNPSTPTNIIKQLTQDHNILVRAAAKHYLH